MGEYPGKEKKMKTDECVECLPGTEKGVFLETNGEEALICRITGEVDHHHASRIRLAVDEEVARIHPPVLLLDLSQVDFMDSAGLGLILGRYNRVKEYGGKLVLRDPSGPIMKILSLSGADRLIPIERTEKKEG